MGMPHEMFIEILMRLYDAGWARDDIEWSENIGPPMDAVNFARELIFICANSGMRFSVSRLIYERVMASLEKGESASAVFGHKGKAAAMEFMWVNRDRLFAEYNAAEDKLEYLVSIPWIGHITKYHAAKNFGLDVVKPDVHLARLAAVYGMTPHDLCADLAAKNGYRIATIDLILWRAAATGILDSRTGRLKPAAAA